MTDYEISGDIEVGQKVTENDPPSYVFQIKMFSDGSRVVQHREPIDGKTPPGAAEFVGIHEHEVRTSRGIARVPLQFPLIGATTVKDAFAFWDGCKQMAVEQCERSVRAQVDGPGVITPGDPRFNHLRRQAPGGR